MIHVYGLILGLSLLLGFNYFLHHNTVVPKSQENFFIFGLFLSAIIGARLYHVADYWSYYSTNIPQIFYTWNGGLGIFGGLIFGLVFVFVFAKTHHLSFLQILDENITIVPLCQSLGRLGNFFNHEIPTWYLESFGCLILFLIISKTPKHYRSTALYLIGYGLLRFSLEFFRTDTWQISHLKIAQLLSLIFIAAGLFLHSFHPKANGHNQ